jgi:hypothetical protein
VDRAIGAACAVHRSGLRTKPGAHVS